MIKEFDRTNLRLISTDIELALTAIEAKYGIKFTYKGASFRPDNATFRIEGATLGVNGVVNTRERDSFKTLASLYGMNETDLDREIIYGGERYVIKGLNTRRSKYPVMATRIRDGKTILLTLEGVKRAIIHPSIRRPNLLFKWRKKKPTITHQTNLGVVELVQIVKISTEVRRISTVI